MSFHLKVKGNGMKSVRTYQNNNFEKKKGFFTSREIQTKRIIQLPNLFICV